MSTERVDPLFVEQSHEHQSLTTPGARISKSCQQASKVYNKLSAFYKQKEFFDIVLIATKDRTEVHAHRVVLCASSDFFLAMLRGNLKEARTSEIELKDIDGEILKSIVDFMYTAAIELNSDTIETIMTAAGYFQIDTLIDRCCEFMANQLDADNCWEIYFFAERNGYLGLQAKSFAYAERNFERICGEKEFLHLTEDQLKKFVSSDELGVSSEQTVFRCILDWVEFDPKNRDNSMFNLLSCVHAGYLTPEFIIEHRYLVCKMYECSELISRWLDWHASPDNKTLLTENQIKPRKAYNLLTFATADGTNLSILVYNRALDTWSNKIPPHPSSPINQVYYDMIQVGRSLVIAGGKIDGKFTARVECLDLQTWQRTELPPMPHARTNFAMAELNECLYVVGGSDGENLLRTVLRYDFALGAWEQLQSLPLVFPGIQVVVLNKVLFATGNFSSVMARYDPDCNTWTQTDFKMRRSDTLSLGAVGCHLYAINSDCAKRYDPALDIWTTVRGCAEDDFGVVCAALNNRLITIEGIDVREYNPETEKWTILSRMPVNDFQETWFCKLSHLIS